MLTILIIYIDIFIIIITIHATMSTFTENPEVLKLQGL